MITLQGYCEGDCYPRQWLKCSSGLNQQPWLWPTQHLCPHPYSSWVHAQIACSQFCKHQELDTLKDLYNQDDDHQELGNFHVRSGYVSEKVGAGGTWQGWELSASQDCSAEAQELEPRLSRC